MRPTLLQALDITSQNDMSEANRCAALPKSVATKEEAHKSAFAFDYSPAQTRRTA